jgi:membrane associated rhomboid family serine protease
MNQQPKKSVFDFISKSDVIKIMVIVTLVFIITNFLKVSAMLTGVQDTPLYNIIYKAIALPSNFKLWAHQPWSILTYMFSAESFLPLLFDLIWLWIFGSVIEDLKGMYRILPIYIVGGILGALAFLFIGQITPITPSTSAVYYLGVMPSMLAVVTATVCYKPKYVYWFSTIRIPIWVLAITFYMLKLGTLQVYSLQNMALIFGGIATGLLYNYGGLPIFDRLTILFKKIAIKGSNENFVEKKTSRSVPPPTHIPASTIDEILDKINQQGMKSLSPTEKKLLESYSKEK